MIVDMHSHVLANVDDGSSSLAESVAMLRLEAQQNISRVVATPHFYARHDTPERFLRRREEAYRKLAEELKNHPGCPEVKLGAEVYFFSGMSHVDSLKLLTIDGKRCILLEMPQPPWTDKMYREIAEIREKLDIIPVIAHVDRYIGRFRTFGIPEKLEELPVLVQANARFFLQRSTRGMAMRMLQKNQIHLLGSDCHNLEERKPRLGEALSVIEAGLGAAALEQIRDYQDLVFE